MKKKKKRKLSIDDRWEAGMDHDPRSVTLYDALARLDYEEGGESFQFKSGGDGEALMYLLDLYYEDLDNENS